LRRKIQRADFKIQSGNVSPPKKNRQMKADQNKKYDGTKTCAGLP
jgi:hypothetical protein